MKDNKVTAQVQERIKARILGRIIPTMIFASVVFNIPLLLSPTQRTRTIPLGVLVCLLLAAWVALGKGKIRLSGGITVAASSIAVVIGMILNGGVLAAAYPATLLVALLATWIYGAGTSSAISLFFSLIGLCFVWLDAHGLVKAHAPLVPWAVWLSMTLFYVMLWGMTAVPRRLFQQALFDSEERRVAAENAFQREEEAVGALKEKTQALRKSEEQYRELIQNVPLGLYRSTLETESRFLLANPELARIMGFDSVEDLLNSPVSAHYYEPADRAVMLEGIQKWGQISDYELRLRRRDGSAVWASVNAQTVCDDAGNVLYVDGFIQDITERKQAEQEREVLQAQLAQSQKIESVGRLAGGVAHDFNNMLAVILGHSELALLELDESHPVCGDLKEIWAAASRSAQLTGQLLAFARRQTVAPEVLDLNKSVSNMLSLLNRLMGENIHLAWVPCDELWPVKMDPSQFDQIMMNLCVNARDAIAGDGNIIIETKNICLEGSHRGYQADIPAGYYVQVLIRDDGCGMDTETIEHIFDPFFTTKDKGSGTGLGLSTVYGAIRQNEGFIDVHSEPGHGSTFTFYLPRVLDIVSERAVEQPALPRSRGETILLIEDEASVLQLGKVMLTRLGYEVICAASPQEALHWLGEHDGQVDLLITDVIMPTMNGWELASMAREIAPGIRCLFMSGYPADVISQQGILDPGLHFLEKPFNLQSLGAKVRAALDRAD